MLSYIIIKEKGGEMKNLKEKDEKFKKFLETLDNDYSKYCFTVYAYLFGNISSKLFHEIFSKKRGERQK